jgi:hypothetical protein
LIDEIKEGKVFEGALLNDYNSKMAVMYLERKRGWKEDKTPVTNTFNFGDGVFNSSKDLVKPND